ncbi:MAG: protoporphyrinogen oxidase [Caldilineaceae bacterium]
MTAHPIPNPQSPFPTAIIGGGITGLTAAWELQKAGVPYILLEKSTRVGGKIQTDQFDGFGDAPFIIERAGDAFLAAQKPWAMELAYELGLDDEILTTNSVQPSVYILKNGALVPVPAGLQLIIPTNRDTFLASPLMSEDGKARALDEEMVDPYMGDDDESVADFVRRRLGDEAVEMLAEPLLSGIYSAHPEEQSLLATFPRYRQLEQKYGSLIGGVRKIVEEGRSRGVEKNGGPSTNSGAKGEREKRRDLTAFITFKGGTETLVKALERQLTSGVRLGVAVDGIERNGADGYVLRLADGESISAGQVLVTTPAAPAAKMLQIVAPAAVEQLQTLRVVSTGVVFLGYRRADVTHPLNGFGVVIPRREGRSINAMTWMTTKFDHRAPADHVLIRVFFGGARTPEMMAKNDDEVTAIAQAELRELIGLEAAPVLRRVYRWIDAQPQYDVGHLERMKQIEESLPAGIQIAGSPYGGVGIPDCVRQGREAARSIVASLR